MRMELKNQWLNQKTQGKSLPEEWIKKKTEYQDLRDLHLVKVQEISDHIVSSSSEYVYNTTSIP